MVTELSYFCAMVFFGVLAAFGYHLLLLFRAVVKHSVPLVDAEDILFLAAAGVFFFLTAYKQNDGILRWYAFAGAGLGCLAYRRTAGISLERVRKWLLQKFGKTVKMKRKYKDKGQVSSDERSPKHGKKEKKKKRS